ncbi:MULTISPECIES: DNA polymerase IV [Gammaproteobacteria]|uniref:DNA polymerase IV n=1 Tax=Gammaproteobacteria TaxID=1236 RepID=UPI000DD03F19|nr:MULTISPECIES: DNA polymerase IV [Gammaproteobacteria]RTE86546.1 DNA polymerase IV [Aliidiomarina sp. B3213]TCZ90899.1 DNA polymerase IV [Lysobacter sp. N42]
MPADTTPDAVQRKIALLDLDAFFAAVEVTKNPALKNIPFAVGGGGERGVVATCNYEARKYGVRSAMSGFKARQLCPHLTFVKPDMASYKEVSKKVRALLSEYTDLVEPASIDEFYLDLSHLKSHQGSASLAMEDVRAQLRTMGISGSAGISNQKMVAKIASDENKPDGQFVVPPEQVFSFISALSLSRIPGVGPKSQERLANAGFRLGKDIQRASVEQVQQILGEKSGYVLHQRCQGIDLREVSVSRTRKQISVEDTLARDFAQLKQAEVFIEKFLLPSLKKRLPPGPWQGTRIRTQTVKLKFNDFQQTTVSRSANKVSPSLFYQLLGEAWARAKNRKVRLIGLGVTLPDPDEDRQLELDLE